MLKGETAVDFAFTPSALDESPTCLNAGEDENVSPNICPLFILHGNGDVYCLVTSDCGLNEDGTKFIDDDGSIKYPSSSIYKLRKRRKRRLQFYGTAGADSGKG